MSLPPPGPDAAVLVTGASSGIGAAVARVLAGRGHPTVLVARRGDALTELAAELRAVSGQASEVHAADLGTDAGLTLTRDLLDDDRVVGLVNAAGFGVTGRVADLAGDADRRAALDGLVRLNVLALHDLTVARSVRSAAACARTAPARSSTSPRSPRSSPCRVRRATPRARRSCSRSPRPCTPSSPAPASP